MPLKQMRLGILAFLVLPQILSAATFTVTNTNNIGAGSLNQAITDANAAGGADVIDFAIPGAGVHLISLTTVLPNISGPVTINGQSQPGFSGSPLIRVDGNGLVGVQDCFKLIPGSSGTIIRGLMITRFSRDAIIVQSGVNSVTIAGNWIGTSGTGSTGMGNTDDGIEIAGTGVVIGGTGANDRNVITNNGDEGITIVSSGVSNISIIGNTIGLDPDGSTGNGNVDVGIAIITGTGNTIGGLTAASRNVVSMNVEGIEINTSNNVVWGNYIGTDVSGTLAKGNHGGDGVQVQGSSSNNSVGGEAVGAGNLIAFNAGNGVNVVNGNTHVIVRNSIHSNTLLGINLGPAGVTPNDLGDGDGGANNLQNFPVLTTAATTGASITINGTFNSNASTSFRIEFYYNTAADGSGNGEGQTFFGVADVTTDGSGNSPIFTTLPATVPAGAIISAIASRLNLGDSPIETSEFSQNIVATSSGASINGTVFEDVNFGGGAGRDRATAMGNGGSLRQNARVELFNNAGNYVSATTTNASGAYTFGPLAAGNYTIRVVNNTVTSSRTGYVAAHRAVQTFRTNASGGSAVAVTDRVGGEVPVKEDAINGSTTLATLTTVTLAPQSITTVSLAASNIGNVDFGFNFNLVVNKNDAGQGSLRQFITQANALSNTGMATQGRTASIDHAIFMLADGTARPGLQAAYPTMFSGGIASIAVQTALPTITSAVVIDAKTQPNFVSTPLIELNGGNLGSFKGLELVAGSTGSAIRGFIINRFTGTGLEISNSNNHIIQLNWIGLNSAGSAASANAIKGIYALNSTGHLIGGTTAGERNVISGNVEQCIYFDNTSNSTISGNYIGPNATATGDVDGTAQVTGKSGVVLSNGSSGNTIGGTSPGARNVLSGNNHYGFEVIGSTSINNVLQGNYIGTTATGLAPLANNGGASFWGAGAGNIFGGGVAGAGNVISGNQVRGILIGNASNTATVQGNYIGLGADGVTIVANGFSGIQVEGGSTNTLIGTDANGSNDINERNVISGNGEAGIRIAGTGTNSTLVQGNYIGTDVSGNLDKGNLQDGVVIRGGAQTSVIGGTTVAKRNIISGNDNDGVWITDGSTSGNLVQGNWIGIAANSNALGNSYHGVAIENSALNNTVGGTAVGAGNRIFNNSWDGVAVANAAGNGNAILGNAIGDNGDLGIDLNNDGVTANDLNDPDPGPNGLQNFPVLTSAVGSGGNTTIVGTLNSTNATFRIEFFSSPAADVPSGYGEGQTYLGTVNVTTVANNATINTTLTGVTVPSGHVVSATATNTTTNSTSEFSLSIASSSLANISGTIYEDVNYGGGAGRDRATAMGNAGSLRQNARVELYNNAGNFVSFATTNASGAYTFSSLANGNYTIRVVNSSVTSSRTGYVAAHLAVQTFRTDASSGSATAATDRVGGEVPAKADAANGSTSLAALTTATLAPQSITSVALGSSNISNVDFGFNFNTVVNKNNTGQGSLRQFITQANALSNAGLATQGRTAGIDHAIFMLADVTARPGLTASYPTMFVGGAATLAPTTALTAITAPVVIDATTQPNYAGSPIIEINGIGAGAAVDGFWLNTGSGGSTISGFVINRFLGDGIQVNTAGNTIRSNYIGLNVVGNTDFGNTLMGINVVSSANTIIGGTAAGAGNKIAGNGSHGIFLSGATGSTVHGNTIGVNAAGNGPIRNDGNGITINGGGTNQIGGSAPGAANVISGNNNSGTSADGIFITSSTGNIIQGNFIGTDIGGTIPLGNFSAGVACDGNNNLIGGTNAGEGNTIRNNGNYGVRVGGSGTGNRILRNSIYNSGLLGIDLNNDGVTYNDYQDPDPGPNAKQNFPKLTSAFTNAGNTAIQGTFNSTPNTTYRIEYFSNTAGDFSGYGEGEIYLGTNNVTTNNAGNATINILLTGVSVTPGHAVCATATNLTTNNTSEFSAFAYAPTDNDGDGVTDDIDMDDDNDGIPDDIEDLGFDSRGGTIPCTLPGMTFQTPALVSGAPLATGSVYRFPNVITGVDVLLTIGVMVNATINNIDITGTGFNDAFQPGIDFSGLGTPGVDFHMQFVNAGTAVPAASVTRFGGTTYDVDGTPMAESFLFYNPSAYAVDQPTKLVHQLVPGAVDISGDGTSDAPGISADPLYRAYFHYKNVNQFSFRAQFKRTATGTSSRQMCLRFNECFLNDMVNVQLYIIEGSDRDNDGIPDYLDLDSDNDGIYDCVESGSAKPHTNGVLNGAVTAMGLPVAVDLNNDNAIDYVLRDSDGDNIYDAIELDSDNDGCNDVIEAGYTDADGDGRLGPAPLLTNNNGVVISGGP